MATKKTSHDSETPAKNRQVITACAFIHKKIDGVNKVFLPKRANTKKFLPGIYETPGGHIDFGEGIKEGLKREIFEEFGININIGDAFYAFTYQNKIKGSHSVEVLFFATLSGKSKKITLAPEDHSEYGWFSEEEIENKVIGKDKLIDDPEIQAIYKAFKLLRGAEMDFG